MVKSPFKFLDAYQKEDKAAFFGREKETNTLYDEIFKTNLMLIYGASGSGKTSLINCGLGNKYAETDWMAISIRRRENIIESIFRAIRAHAETEIPQETPIRRAIHSLYLDTYLPIYLIFDQFEELFILGSPEEQHHFFQALSEILQANLRCKVILSMREEYLAYLSDFEKQVPSLFDHRFRVERMSYTNIEEVIVSLTQYHEIELAEPGKTVGKIIDQLRSKQLGVDLTHLQVYLDRLYRKDYERKGGDASPATPVIGFDVELIDQVGKVQDVLSEFLDEQLAEIDQKIGKPGAALAILFAFVSDNATNQFVNVSEVINRIDAEKEITQADIEFCLKEFETKRILKPVNL